MNKEKRDAIFNRVYETVGGPAEFVNQIIAQVETCQCGKCVYCATRECPMHDPNHYAHGGCPSERDEQKNG